MTTVRLTGTGRPTGAETNTGQPPSCTNLFLLVGPAERPQRADLVQVDATMGLAATLTVCWHPGWNEL